MTEQHIVSFLLVLKCGFENHGLGNLRFLSKSVHLVDDLNRVTGLAPLSSCCLPLSVLTLETCQSLETALLKTVAQGEFGLLCSGTIMCFFRPTLSFSERQVLCLIIWFKPNHEATVLMQDDDVKKTPRFLS